MLQLLAAAVTCGCKGFALGHGGSGVGGNMADFVSEILSKRADGVSGLGGSSMHGEHEDLIAGLVSVGALTEVGANAMRGALGHKAKHPHAHGNGAPHPVGSGLPSPPFAQSARDTERRAPLGFSEDGTGHNYFTLAASIGAITTMRAKVSRVAHVDRLLIVPSAAGAVLESVKVGDEEQTLASGVPVELYGTSALTDTVPDNFSPIGPGLDFIVTLRNTTASGITGTIGTKCAVKR